MSRRSLSILLLFLAVIAIGVVWLVRTVAVDAATATDALAASPDPDRVEPAAQAPAPSIAEATAPNTPAPAEIESTSPAVAREAIEEDENAVDMTGAWTVEGRVELPLGTPADERVHVLAAVGDPSEPKVHSRSDVAADGSFRVSFSKSAAKGQLILEARYLFLSEPQNVSPETIAKLTGPIVLHPDVGGCIHGRLVLARNALDRRDSLVGNEIELSGNSPSARNDWSNQIQRNSKIDDALEFEFGGLPPARSYHIYFRPKDLVDTSADDLRVEPGRVLPVDLELRLGARIAGRAVDEKGAPVEGVELSVEIERGMGSSYGGSEEKTAADGSFSIGGIRPGKVALRFSRTGFAYQRSEIGPLADGDVRTGIEGVLRRGLSVTGRVLWPDGSPAKRARLEYRFAREEGRDSFRFFSTESDHVTASDDGAFEISGLGEKPIAVTAQAEESGKEATATEASTSTAETDPASEATPARSWTAHRDDVAPGTRDLVLTLEEGASIRGRAVDDEGSPLAGFLVRAEPADGSQPWDRGQRAIHSSGNAGEFTLEGLHAGEWDLVAEAKQHAPSSPRRIRIPREDETVELVLPRAAKLTGIVVDGAGVPVPKARAAARAADAASRFDWNREDKSYACDAEGRFEIDDVPPGPVKVTATADGMAASAPLSLELTPGQVVSDLSLALRRPGRITGEIVDDAGRPIPGRPINVNGTEEQSYRNLSSDASGRFEIDGLTPDRYWIHSQPSEEELAEIAPEESDRRTVWAKYQKMAMVRVQESETTHVVLGGAPKDGVRVHGTIYAGSKRDRAVPGCALWIHKQAAENSAPISGTSDAQGQYEIVVPGAGEYGMSVMNEKQGTTMSTKFTVPPDEESFEHDIVLPGGRIAGSVVGLDGKPAASVAVSCAPEAMTASLSGEASYGNTTTDDAGAFAFDGLRGATYRFEAGAQDWQNLPGVTGKCVRGNVVLEEGGRIEDLELRLQPQCRVEGVAVGPDGRPAAGASVYARDETGNVLQRWPPTSADASGRFSMDRLPPGKVTFAARTKKLASLESAPVVLKAGETAKVELSLRAGTRLRVIVREGDDRVVGAFVTIADASGRDVTMMYAFQNAEFFGQSTPGEGQLIGPVPPGSYRLTATNHDRKSASTEVSVSGQEEEVVTLRFGG